MPIVHTYFSIVVGISSNIFLYDVSIILFHYMSLALVVTFVPIAGGVLARESNPFLTTEMPRTKDFCLLNS